jgi:hypothetical protein
LIPGIGILDYEDIFASTAQLYWLAFALSVVSFVHLSVYVKEHFLR